MPLTPPTLSPPAISSYHHLLTTFLSHLLFFESQCDSPHHPFLFEPRALQLVLRNLFSLNLNISHLPSLRSRAKYHKPPQQLHLLSVRKVEGHARRSWHQPVTPPFLLPPSVSLLNQITPLTHAYTNPFLNQLSPSSCPFVFICSAEPCTLCSLYLPASPTLCNKTYIAAVQLGKKKKKVRACTCLFCVCVFVCLRACVCEQYNTEQRNDGWGCRFILIKFPSSFLHPSCVSACPRSKCQQNLGTWSGIWCHIAQRTWIQKTSQHGELTWSTAKPAATH